MTPLAAQMAGGVGWDPSGGKVYPNKVLVETRLFALWSSPVAPLGCLPDDPIWMGLPQAACGCPGATPKGLSDYNQWLLAQVL